MKRNTRQRGDLEPSVALAASLVALSAAVRYTSAGLRTVVGRATTARAEPNRRPRTGSAAAGRRGTAVRRVFGAQDSLARRMPADYVAAGVLAGTTGTIVLALLLRSLFRWVDAGPSASAGGAVADVPAPDAGKVHPTVTRNGRRRSSGGSRPLVVLRRIGETPDQTPAPAPDARSAKKNLGTADAEPEPAPSGKKTAGRRQ